MANYYEGGNTRYITIEKGMKDGCEAIEHNFNALKSEINQLNDWEEFPVTPLNGSACGGCIMKHKFGRRTIYLVNLSFQSIANKTHQDIARFKRPWSSDLKIVAVDGTSDKGDVGFVEFNRTKNIIEYYRNPEITDIHHWIRVSGVIID